jgi:hypothetical protein
MVWSNQNRSMTQLNLNPLQDFRHEGSGWLTRAADALFNTGDARLTQTQAHAFPQWSLSPVVQRRWGSLDEACEAGRLAQQRVRRVLMRSLLRPVEGERVWLGRDASRIERPQSQTSPARTVVSKPTLPESSRPSSSGWPCSTVVRLPGQPSRWTAVLAQQRIRSDQPSGEGAAEHLRQLAPLLDGGCRPIVASARCSRCAPVLVRTQGLPCDQVLRLTRKRVLDRAAPARTGTRGAPRKEGERLQGGTPSPEAEASGSWQGTDAKGPAVEITWGHRWPLPKARQLEVTGSRMLRHGATDRPRDPLQRWLLWDGSLQAWLPAVALG